LRPRAVFFAFFAAAIGSSCLNGCWSNAAKNSSVPERFELWQFESFLCVEFVSGVSAAKTGGHRRRLTNVLEWYFGNRRKMNEVPQLATAMLAIAFAAVMLVVGSCLSKKGQPSFRPPQPH
jgi:hypothetical protein